MVCAACEKRRKMIREAYKRGGVTGVYKEMPKVGKDVLKNPPAFIRRAGQRDKSIR